MTVIIHQSGPGFVVISYVTARCLVVELDAIAEAVMSPFDCQPSITRMRIPRRAIGEISADCQENRRQHHINFFDQSRTCELIHDYCFSFEFFFPVCMQSYLLSGTLLSEVMSVAATMYQVYQLYFFTNI